jgi:DNA-binding transcriptional ArsR family regulator
MPMSAEQFKSGERMQSKDSRIGAISTFLQQLEHLKGDVPKGQQLYFRGHAKSSYELAPSIYRNRGWIDNEATMLKEVVLRCPGEFAGSMSTFQTLARLQHYGLPTRLLDVTTNPLVALYFACQIEDGGEDAEVIVMSFDVKEVKYFDSDTVNVVANLSRRPSDFFVPDIENLDAFNADGSIKLLHHDVCQDRPHFEPKIRRADLQRVVCVRPRLENPRIIRQEGAFLLFGCNGVKSQAASIPKSSVLTKLTINREKKRLILDQLETLGLSKATLFPEIDAVAFHVKGLYASSVAASVALGPNQQSVRDALAARPSASSSEIASATGLSMNAVVRALATLRDLGLVEGVGFRRLARWRLVVE